MEIHPLIDPYAIHYSTFTGDVYTLATASITLTAGTLTADTITDGTLSITGGDLTTTGTGIFGNLEPYDDETFDLGHPGFRWRNLFLSADAKIAGTLGVGIAAPTTDKVSVFYAPDVNTGTFRGIFSELQIGTTGASDATGAAVHGFTRTGSSDVHSGAAYGIRGKIQADLDQANVTGITAGGFFETPILTITNELTAGYGVYIAAGTTSGATEATEYGLFIENLTVGTTKYAIKTNGGLVNFAGPSGAETTTFEIDHDDTVFGPTIKGTTTRDGTERIFTSSNFTIIDNQRLVIGTSQFAALRWSTAGTGDFCELALNSGNATFSGNFVINHSVTFPSAAYPVVTHPTLRIQASSTTIADNIRFHHDGSNAIVEYGTGGIRFGTASNYSEFEADGTLEFNGTATVFNDIVLPLDSAKVPAANAPNWESFVGNLNAFAYQINDFQEFTAELIHGYKEGSTFEFHIHGALNALTAQEEKVQFEIEYSISNANISTGIGDVFPDGSGSLLIAELVVPDATADLTNIHLSIGVDTTGTFGLDATIKGRIRRIAKSAGGNELTGNIFLTQVGIHYEIDTVGSRTRNVK